MILNNSKLLIGAAVLTAIGFGTMQSAKALPLAEHGLVISQTSTSPTPVPSRVTTPSQTDPSSGTAPSSTNPTNENNTPSSDGSSGSTGGSMGGSMEGGSMQDTTPSGGTSTPSRVTAPSQANPSSGAAPSETNPSSGTSSDTNTVRATVDQIVGSNSVRVSLPDGTKRLVTVKDPNVFSQLAPGDTVVLTMRNDEVVDVARAPVSSSGSMSSGSMSSGTYQRRTTTTTTQSTQTTPQSTTTETTTPSSQPAPVRALW